MNIWIMEKITFCGPVSFIDESKNLIIVGTINSDSDLVFKVNNLIVFGKINTTKNLTIHVKSNGINVGEISCKGELKGSGTFCNGLNNESSKN